MSRLSSADTDAGTDVEPVDEAEVRAGALIEELQAALGDSVVQTETRQGDAWIRVSREAWASTATTLRGLGFDYFCFLSAIDWMPSAPNAEDAEAASVEPEADAEDAPDADAASEAVEERDERADPAGSTATEVTTPDAGGEAGWETGVAGGDTRFQILARLYSPVRKEGVTLKADLDDEEPRVDSWSRIFRGADWHERETWEMYGITFDGHPGLRHLYLPSEFEGFPLRKDYPLLAREVKPWPGLVDVEPMPDEDEAAAAGDAAGEEG